ncbi:MAG: hypothetical protein WAL22_20740 [Solirubrobacteraceae bacterium]
MSRQPERSSGTALTRRRFLAGGTALVVGGGAAAVAGCGSSEPQPGQAIAPVALGGQPAGLPSRQFAWTETLPRDADGNPVAARHDRLLMFDVNGRPGTGHARLLEAALRTLERRYRWGPEGLLFATAWGVPYFTRVLQRPSPIPAARALSDFELPAIDGYDLCLHLACDDELRLAEIEAALVHGQRLPGADGRLDISPALTWRETRTGFTGAGLPTAHQHVDGIPAGAPVAPAAPLYMGFKSNLKRNQASEDAVAIASGPFAGGTTMAVSYMRLRLDSWYGELTQRERVTRMYAPQVSVAQAARFTTDAASDPGRLRQAIDRYGVIGHAQTSARARRNGKPLILRRDFNTTDGGQAGLHFVSLQRDIADFVRTRTAMNASSAQLRNPAITDTVNNGINEFIFVARRGNYIVPPRARRSFPLIGI